MQLGKHLWFHSCKSLVNHRQLLSGSRRNKILVYVKTKESLGDRNKKYISDKYQRAMLTVILHYQITNACKNGRRPSKALAFYCTNRVKWRFYNQWWPLTNSINKDFAKWMTNLIEDPQMSVQIHDWNSWSQFHIYRWLHTTTL